LYGIFAEDKENPSTVGKDLLEEYRKLDADESYEVTDYPEAKKLELPTGDEFCKAWENGCIAYLFSSNVDAESLMKKHRVLISRSNIFLDFEEYTTLAKPSVYEIIPPYLYIVSAERIKVLHAISVYKSGNTLEAVDSLLTQFSKLRKSMALQDSLIGKTVFLMKLSEIIDVLSVILIHEDVSVELIPKLSTSEKSFYRVAAREFRTHYDIIKELDRHPEFFKVDGNFPGWITRIVFKPNMTVNSIVPIYTRFENLAKMTPYEIARQIENNTTIRPSTSKLRNYAGNMFIKISSSFDGQIAKFSDFEAKLAIFNQLHHLKLKRESMNNPYYGNEAPKQTNGSLCFSGPLEDKSSLRCLKVEI
jgi:hypothetical protein